jgi:beta-lactamase regulating signal transducer with metallopeptidase domain
MNTRTEAVPEAAQAPGSDNLWPWRIAVVYLGVSAALLLRLLIEWWSVRRFAGRTHVVRDSGWNTTLAACAARLGLRRRVRLLRSRSHSVPLSFGTRAPAIVIPTVADTWDDDRREAVLLHELAHVMRFDCATQTLARVACALYWCHPAVWWIAHQLRVERELACDDCVIASGTGGREYATHLLEIAYSVGGFRAPALAVAMARPRQLERRLLAALDRRRNRGVPQLRHRAMVLCIVTVMLVAVAGAMPTIVVRQQESGPRPPTRETTSSTERDVVPKSLKAVQWPIVSEVRTLIDGTAEMLGIGQDVGTGTWELRKTSTSEVVYLRLTERHNSSSFELPLAELQGLTARQLDTADGPIQFRLTRDAGTFTFDGVIRHAVGAGTFTFTPSPTFASELVRRGFRRPTAREQYELARGDIGVAFLEELVRQGYAKPDTDELVRAGQHGVNAVYLREMGALGYRLGSLAPLIELRDHGITPDYVRALASLGYKDLPADAIRQARDHGITPEYVQDMRDAGYGSLSMQALVNARDHGVTPEYVGALAAAGFRSMPIDEVIRVRDHGVSPEYVRGMGQLGFSVPLGDLVQARDHGVDLEFARDMNALGYARLPLTTLIQARDHGVTADYVREVKALGYEGLPVGDLITLRDRGLTAERIRRINTRAGTRLPVEALIDVQ